MDKHALEALESTTAAAVMSRPGGVVRSGASAWQAVEQFLTGPARHVIVLDPMGRHLGIIGTRHLGELWPLDIERLKAEPVESLGFAAWAALSPEADLSTCAKTLTEHELDAVPVLDEDKRVIGVVTARDVTRVVADAEDRKRYPWQV
jgi:CBS-domain-containing membrane protein